MAYLLQFGESKRVTVLGSELHEPHIGRVCELSDDAETGKQPEGGMGECRERDVSGEVKCFVWTGTQSVAMINAFNFGWHHCNHLFVPLHSRYVLAIPENKHLLPIILDEISKVEPGAHVMQHLKL